MITRLIYCCKACGHLFTLDVSKEKGLHALGAQVSFHRCMGDLPTGIPHSWDAARVQDVGDLVAFYETHEEDIP